eukprot:scaffold1402_cov254-Pinguiococcus_pyrenoidosus.AAC.12
MRFCAPNRKHLGPIAPLAVACSEADSSLTTRRRGSSTSRWGSQSQHVVLPAEKHTRVRAHKAGGRTMAAAAFSRLASSSFSSPSPSSSASADEKDRKEA